MLFHLKVVADRHCTGQAYAPCANGDWILFAPGAGLLGIAPGYGVSLQVFINPQMASKNTMNMGGGGGGVDGSVVGKLHGFVLLWAGNGYISHIHRGQILVKTKRTLKFQ